MPVYKTPKADLKRKYPIYRQIGAIAALSVTIAAFTIPLPDGETVVEIETEQEVIQLEEIDQTQQIEPPPPPPAALPPPQEVPDHVEVENEVIEEIELDLSAEIAVPSAPPPPAAAEPPPMPEAPPPPPPEPEPTEPEIFEVAEVQPELIGGLEGLQARVEYPDLAVQAGVEGTVVVQFVVDERGNVVDPVVLRTPNPILTQAAVEAVVASKFTPGQQRGRPVRVRYAVPVRFQLVN